jgi:short chain dehydrogenase
MVNESVKRSRDRTGCSQSIKGEVTSWYPQWPTPQWFDSGSTQQPSGTRSGSLGTPGDRYHAATTEGCSGEAKTPREWAPRASEWHSRGHGFDPHQLQQLQQELSGTTDRRGRGVHFLSIFEGNAQKPLGTPLELTDRIGTNLKGVPFAVQSAVPLMPSGGSIVLIGSTASVAPPPGMSIYGAIKAGFHGLVRALVQDLATAITAVPLRSPVRYRRPPPATAIGAGGTDSIGGRSRE